MSQFRLVVITATEYVIEAEDPDAVLRLKAAQWPAPLATTVTDRIVLDEFDTEVARDGL